MSKYRTVCIALALASAASVAHAELPNEMSYKSLHCFAGEANIMQSTDTYTVYGFHLRGIGRSQLKEDLLGPLSSECVGTGRIVDSKAEVTGFCQFTDADGDAYLGEFDRVDKNGEWTVVSGSGKFSKMSGGGTYVLTQHPRIAPGRFQGCADSEGTYKFH